MSQAYFQGSKQYLPVAPHLDGLSAVGSSTKVSYHLLNAAFVLGPYLLGLGTVFLASKADSESVVQTFLGVIAMIFMLMLYVIPVINLVMILMRGRTLPMAMMKVRAVDVRTGKPATGMLFLKILLEGVIAYFSLGIGFVIVVFLSQDEFGRTWFDRVANTMMVSTARGRDPYKTPILAHSAPLGYSEASMSQQSPLHGHATYGQAPAGHAQNGQPPFGQAQYGQAQYGQVPDTPRAYPGAPSPYPPSTTAQAPYGQAPHEHSPSAQAPFAQPAQAPFANGSPYPPPAPQTPHATPDPTNPDEQGRQI
ncbi:RDD family protein [Schaalia sp. Marseille-Q2122]|uniref:RDD family protein n=1 Tax=Schaalia sp. Marseille-Q2122 TaxID=2736604 RepID=UPI00158D8887|nr:RDD family protein [Schaalia sp. Marseille-Q2122]